MLVCGHGNVLDYCSKRGMVIIDTHVGDIIGYKGLCKVVVTDEEMPESKYYYLKGKMLAHGYELVSTRYQDTELAANIVVDYTRNSGNKHPGRCRFGFRRVNGEVLPHEDRMDVVRRILELKDKGCTLHEIQDDEIVRHTDGRKLSISTIQLIIKNRDKYDEYL